MEIIFDLVGWHHRHTLELLEPVRGIRELLDQGLRAIRSIDRRIRFRASVQWFLIPSAVRNESPKDELVTAIYTTVPNHAAAINQWVRELEEAALRSLEQVETRVVSAAIDSMSSIGDEYLTRRRNTLRPILASPLGVFESDLRDVLTPLYESLSRVGQRATTAKNEPVVIRV